MIYNTLFPEEWKISNIGIGFAAHEKNESQKIVDYAIQHGVNYFEAATFYLNNECEVIVGNCLKKYDRSLYFLCDKINLMEYENLIKQKKFDLELFFNNQLKKCRTEYFDIYLFQGVNLNVFNVMKDYPEILDFFIQKKKEGKIKKLGFSFHDNLDTLKKFFTLYDWDIIQILINFYDWYQGHSKKLYQFITDKNIPIIAMSPARAGIMAQSIPKEAYDKILQDENIYKICLSFVQALPNVKLFLTGAQNISQLKQNIQWTNEKNPFIKKYYYICQLIINYYTKSSYIPCTYCHYCETVCPKHLRISDMFKYTNNILLNNNKEENYEQLLKIILSQQNLYNCIKCDNCEKICTQRLKIQQYFNTVILASQG